MGTYCHGILVVIPPAKRFQSISSLVQVPELRDHAVVFSTALALQAELENTSMSSDYQNKKLYETQQKVKSKGLEAMSFFFFSFIAMETEQNHPNSQKVLTMSPEPC